MKMSVPCQRYQTCSCMPACRLQHKPRLCSMHTAGVLFSVWPNLRVTGFYLQALFVAKSPVARHLDQIISVSHPAPEIDLLCSASELYTRWSAHIISAIQSKPLSKSFERVLCKLNCSGCGWGRDLGAHHTLSGVAVHLLMNSAAPTAGMCRVRPAAPARATRVPTPQAPSESISNSHGAHECVMEHQGDKFMHTCTRRGRPVAAGRDPRVAGTAVRACPSLLARPCPWSELWTIQLQSLELFQGDRSSIPQLLVVDGRWSSRVSDSQSFSSASRFHLMELLPGRPGLPYHNFHDILQ